MVESERLAGFFERESEQESVHFSVQEHQNDCAKEKKNLKSTRCDHLEEGKCTLPKKKKKETIFCSNHFYA